MKIVPNQVFLHENDRYEPDQEYDVPLEDGVYFCRNGWADSAETETVTSDPDQVIDLDIHNASVAVKDSNG